MDSRICRMEEMEFCICITRHGAHIHYCGDEDRHALIGLYLVGTLE